jgi:hypothetical protein
LHLSPQPDFSIQLRGKEIPPTLTLAFHESKRIEFLHMTKSYKKIGFTLIELMIVIAIIGLEPSGAKDSL